jgi:TolB-like protein
MIFKFDDHVLDIERCELRRGPEPVALEPQVFDLLAYLVSNRGRVVSKDDLIKTVWRGRIVSDSALTTWLNAVRRAVNDSGAAQRVIRTVARKGVRFIAKVEEDGAALEAPAAAPEPSVVFRHKPSVAVLPFANLSGDPEQAYFADGIVEEIITALSRIRWLFVIGRNSSFRYKGQVIDVRRVGRELGVRYVLEGTVRKAGGHVRVTAQLIDAASRAHLWADRFDGSLEDVFELQDNVAASVAGVIEPAVEAAEAARWAARPTTDLGPYDAISGRLWSSTS